jgi:N-methylhydantoinase A
MGLLVGVDVGGTFTDIVVLDSETGRVRVAKLPTTPHNQAEAILEALRAVDCAPASIETLVHGTTVGTNAVLERRGSRCGLITTRGFRDLLELGRRTRPSTYGLTGTFVPLILREDRLEVDERMEAGGRVRARLNEDDVRRAVRHLRDRGVESLVIHFIHAYESPAHEQRATTVAAEEWPTPYLTSSAELLPAIREFERLMTAVVNAYVQPLIHRYVTRLQRELMSQDFAGQFVITQSTGGAVNSDLAWTQAARMVLSGPAAGVAAAAEIARAAGFGHVVSCDMGGTSFDVALIVDGAPHVATEKDLDYKVPFCLPMIDIETIGAGGGSIASVDGSGLLVVGPRSAGAVPGPVCYNQGGTEPTVTDANVFLGRLDPAVLPSGSATGAVESAIRHAIATPLGLSLEESAEGILRLANNKMAMAVRSVSLERGFDPRNFVLVAFGGAGPLHAVTIAREIGIPQVVIPLLPGVTSAYGCLLGDVRHDFVQTVNCLLEDADPQRLSAILRDHAASGEALLARDVGVTMSRVMYEADLQYEGQTHVLRLPFGGPGVDLAGLATDFRKSFEQRFGLDVPFLQCQLVNLRTAVIGRRIKLDLGALYRSVSSERRPSRRNSQRSVYLDGKWVTCEVMDRLALVPGRQLTGPLILEQPDATTLLDASCKATVDNVGSVIIDCRTRL